MKKEYKFINKIKNIRVEHYQINKRCKISITNYNKK